MSATIEFIFDFGSANAYLAYRALPRDSSNGPARGS